MDTEKYVAGYSRLGQHGLIAGGLTIERVKYLQGEGAHETVQKITGYRVTKQRYNVTKQRNEKREDVNMMVILKSVIV